MPATTGDHMDRAFCRLYEQLKARAEAEGTDLDDGADPGDGVDLRENADADDGLDDPA